MLPTLPFQAEGGMIYQPSGILSATKKTCDTHTLVGCPITKLPAELVIHIMRSGLDLRSKRSLSQVSCGFRDVSFLVPEFWSAIVPKFPLEEDQLDYWKKSIVNSKTAPLDIALTIPDPSFKVNKTQGFRPLFLELVIHSARWRTFKLYTELPAPMNAFLKETIPVAVFPQLEHLRLACADPIDTHGAAWSIYGRPGEPSPIMPRLRSLTLWNVWARHPRGILNDLVELRIIGDMLGTTPLEEIVGMLKSSPSLEVLYLTAAIPSLNDLYPPPVTNKALHVVLPRLRSLTFRGLSRMAGICILPLLHLPALEEFHLENALAWLNSCLDVPDRPQILPEDYSSVIQVITYLNMPWQNSSDAFIAPPGSQWPHEKLKKATLSWVTVEAMPLFEWLSFMCELTTLRAHFSDTDIFRVLQDKNVCPQLQTLDVKSFMDPITRNELERVIRARPNLEVRIDPVLPGSGQIFSSLL